MPILASDLANQASGALTDFAAAVLQCLSTPTTDANYGDYESTAATRRQSAAEAVGTYSSNASTKAAIDCTWQGVAQNNVELCAKLTSLINLIGAVSDPQLSEAATLFASFRDAHLARNGGAGE